MPRHRLNPSQIRVAQALPWDVFTEDGQLLLCKGYRLERESQVEVLLANGLYIDERDLHTVPLKTSARFDAFRLWEHVQTELDVLLRNLRREPNFAARMASLADLIATLAERSADIALAVLILSEGKRYPIAHSLHVAVISELVARRLGWDTARRRSLRCAAMSMNLAMLDLQATLVTQRMAPNGEQRRAIHAHPELAVELLRGAGVEDAAWLRAVLEHHEHHGGGGYPIGIVAPCEEAELIRTADMFAAKLSPRASRPAQTANEAARSLFLGHSRAGAPPYPALLIKEVGIYPPGCFVRLANGEVGIVHKRGASASTPQVIALYSAQGLSYADLVPRDSARSEFAVTAVLPRSAVKAVINPERLWKQR